MKHIHIAMGIGIALFAPAGDALALCGSTTVDPGPSCYNAIGGSNDASTVAGGYSNVIYANPLGYGNTGATISGGSTNQVTAAYATIGGGSHNIIDEDSSYGTICGGSNNTITPDVLYGFIGGGLYNDLVNFGDYSTIGGGYNNLIAGGSSGAHKNYNTIAGGNTNEISVGHHSGFIGGGGSNLVSGDYGSVLGGYNGTASGLYSTVAGGWGNTASGLASFAGGYRANADSNGCFVWADYHTSFTQSCVVAGAYVTNGFVARARGGVEFVTGVNASTGAANAGVTLPSGGGSWASLSDQNAKRDIQSVDTSDVLARVAAMPLATWRYLDEAGGALHMGPMAQDFHEAFKLGGDDRHISNVDADGVALAAIQALHHEGLRKDETINALSTRVATLEKANAEARGLAESLEQANRRAASLEKRLEQIETQLGLKK